MEDSTSSTATCEAFWSVLWCESYIKSSHMFWKACKVIAVVTKKTERQREGERDLPGAAIHSSHAAFRESNFAVEKPQLFCFLLQPLIT